MREIMTELRLIKEDEEVVIYLNGVPADIILTMVLAIDRLASLLLKSIRRLKSDR